MAYNGFFGTDQCLHVSVYRPVPTTSLSGDYGHFIYHLTTYVVAPHVKRYDCTDGILVLGDHLTCDYDARGEREMYQVTNS